MKNKVGSVINVTAAVLVIILGLLAIYVGHGSKYNSSPIVAVIGLVFVSWLVLKQETAKEEFLHLRNMVIRALKYFLQNVKCIGTGTNKK